MPDLDRSALTRELLEVLSRELGTLEQTHRETRASATHEEAKPENDKDTRALEQSYLARGQALRVQELRELIARVRSLDFEGAANTASLGALVTVHDDGEDVERTFFITPAGGGTKLAGGTVLVVTPESPWGRALVGAKLGESREVSIAGTLRDFEVLAIR
jgi:transcription elongation GreA/GreB family factor